VHGVLQTHVPFARASRTLCTALARSAWSRTCSKGWVRELLRGTDGSLSTVALETGFASHSHFATAFRAAIGTTPSEYRRADTPCVALEAR